MAFKLPSMTRETSSTTLTGDIVLAGAQSGYYAFSAGLSNGDTTWATVKFGSDEETGLYTYNSGANSLTRTTIYRSTNGNSAVSWSAGTKDVVCGMPGPSNIPAADLAAFAMLIGALPSGQPGLRNVAGTNGGFEVWQRGAGASAAISVAASTTAYTADRWYLTTGANQASVVAAAAGLTNGSRLAGQVQRNAGQTGTGAMRLAYPLTTDEVAKLRGGTLLLSFVVSTGANWSPTSGTLNYKLYLGTGTQGKRNGVAFTGDSNPISGSVNLSTGASATQVVSSLSSAVGSTISQGEIEFTWTPTGTAGSADLFTIDDVDLRATSNLGTGVAPTFERRSFEDCLHDCLRHYWKTFPYGTAPAQALNVAGSSDAGALIFPIISSLTQIRCGVQHPVPMIQAPSMTYFNPNNSGTQARAWDQGTDCTGTGTLGTSGNPSEKKVDVTFTSPASSAGFSAALHMTADASL